MFIACVPFIAFCRILTAEKEIRPDGEAVAR